MLILKGETYSGEVEGNFNVVISVMALANLRDRTNRLVIFSQICPICLHELQSEEVVKAHSRALGSHAHFFHKRCLQDAFTSMPEPHCPYCRGTSDFTDFVPFVPPDTRSNTNEENTESDIDILETFHRDGNSGLFFPENMSNRFPHFIQAHAIGDDVPFTAYDVNVPYVFFVGSVATDEQIEVVYADVATLHTLTTATKIVQTRTNAFYIDRLPGELDRIGNNTRDAEIATREIPQPHRSVVHRTIFSTPGPTGYTFSALDDGSLQFASYSQPVGAIRFGQTYSSFEVSDISFIAVLKCRSGDFFCVAQNIVGTQEAVRVRSATRFTE